MIKISNMQLWVHDQDEALEFYTKKIGMEIRSDVTVPEMGNFRWLAIGAPGQPELNIVLMPVPGPPMLEESARREVLDLVAKGYSATIFLETDDCEGDYEKLAARGVEFTEKPERRPYGIDAGFRDPSGNSVRLTQTIPMESSN